MSFFKREKQGSEKKKEKEERNDWSGVEARMIAEKLAFNPLSGCFDGERLFYHDEIAK